MYPVSAQQFRRSTSKHASQTNHRELAVAHVFRIAGTCQYSMGSMQGFPQAHERRRSGRKDQEERYAVENRKRINNKHRSEVRRSRGGGAIGRAIAGMP